MPQHDLSGTLFLQIARGRWRATMQTPRGPITAMGETKGDAQHQLDELLVMRSALDFTRKCSRRPQRLKY